MNAITRRVARGAAAASAVLLAAGAFAAPAYADTTADLSLKFAGNTIANGVDSKFGTLIISNAGPADASDIQINFDLSSLDTTKVTISQITSTCTDTGSDTYSCVLGDLTVKSGGSFDFIKLNLDKAPGAVAGSAGSFTATVAHGGTDPDGANNTTTVELAISDDSDPDLTVWAPDIDDVLLDEPVVPGMLIPVFGVFFNQGSQAIDGIKVEVTLPANVTFAETDPNCTHAVGDSTTTCDYAVVFDAGAGDAAIWIAEIGDGADLPSVLAGGVVTAHAKAVVEGPRADSKSEPSAFRKAATFEIPSDIDPSDNSDDFSVLLTDTSGGGGGLPVTGAQVGLISGAGAAVLALGVLLFVAARRRKIAFTDAA